MKLLILMLAALTVTGCSTVQPSRATEHKFAPSIAAPQESTDMPDRLQASWVRTASDELSLRTGRVVGIASLRALDQACQRGRAVEVIAPPSVAAAVLAQTQCLSVWRTMAQDVTRSPQVLLIDRHALVVEGMLRHSSSKPVQQEAAARAQLKRFGHAERLR